MALKYILITNYNQLSEQQILDIEAQASSDSGGVHKFTVSQVVGKEGYAFIQMDEANAPQGSLIYNEEEIKNVVKTPDWEVEQPLDAARKRELRKQFASQLLDQIAIDNESIMTGSDYAEMASDSEFQLLSMLLAPHSAMIKTAYLSLNSWSTKSWITDERRDGYLAKMNSFLSSIGDI